MKTNFTPEMFALQALGSKQVVKKNDGETISSDGDLELFSIFEWKHKVKVLHLPSRAFGTRSLSG